MSTCIPNSSGRSLTEKGESIMTYNNNNNFRLTLGEILTDNTDGYTWYTAVVILKDPGEAGKHGPTEKIVGYLHLFRNYRIQMSMDAEGHGDLGASDVIPYLSTELVPLGREHMSSYITALCYQALCCYTTTTYALEDARGEAISILPSFKDRKALDEFVSKTMDLLEEIKKRKGE